MPLPLIYHPNYSPPFPADHRFPMRKFALLFEFLDSVGMFKDNPARQPVAFSDNTSSILAAVALAHDLDYVDRFRSGRLDNRELRQLGLPWSRGLVERTFTAVAGTILTVDLALEHGLATHLAGGTHHARRAEGHGFCILNDLAIAAHHALLVDGIDRVLVVDCDVHQGDGTARILSEIDQAITVSFHCRSNYPFEKTSGDYDIEICAGAGNRQYMLALEAYWPLLLDRHQPDLVIYDAGADVHREDLLGLLDMDDKGIFERDTQIIESCLERNIPVACVIGGGYMKDLERLAAVHGIVHRAAARLYQQYFE